MASLKRRAAFSIPPHRNESRSRRAVYLVRERIFFPPHIYARTYTVTLATIKHEIRASA